MSSILIIGAISTVIIGAIIFYLWLKKKINNWLVEPFDPDLANDIYELMFPD